MLIRAETPADVAAVRRVTAAAFSGTAHSAPPVEPGGPPGEVALLDALRDDPGWIPGLSLVAEDDGEVIGHVVCSRGRVGADPALGLGPVSVLPDRQGTGVGTALMHAVLAEADARGEPLVVLLGEPAYYRRFGFRTATELGVEPPDPAWGGYFQALPLSAWSAGLRGRFRYASPFLDIGG